MELVFNEISINPLLENKHQSNERMLLFSEAIAESRKRGFKLVRSHYSTSEIKLADGYSMYDWIFDKTFSEVHRSLLMGMIVQPFIKDEDEEQVTEYIEANYYFEDIDAGISKTSCLGLASAYLYETISISFSSSEPWKNNIIYIAIEKDEATSITNVVNVYSRGCFDTEEVKEHIEQRSTLSLLETSIPPNDKKIHISQHHGITELRELWSKLMNSPYVIEGRSTNWGGRRFIRKVYSNGVIEVVLTDSERQYALWVRTTGRNYRETKAIAEKLNENYS
jgi:hypothetical protein